jgi:hypothetical protein
VLHTYQPTRFTLIDSGNQAFSKPNFLADFNNDTIMGKVVKDGSGNYTLQKFGASQGESAFEVHGSNENFTFDANLNGEVTNVHLDVALQFRKVHKHTLLPQVAQQSILLESPYKRELALITKAI